ncbi:TH1-like protein, partial [Capsaspora owczarzaki ATCC 30864]
MKLPELGDATVASLSRSRLTRLDRAICAFQKISDAGHQEEMASVATASTDALVFSRVLVFSVFNFVRQDEDAIKEALPDFVKTVCHGEHTYLYAQALFHALNLRRLFQEVQLYAVDTKNDSIARHVGLVLNGSPAFPQVTSAVASMLNAKSCTPGDINTLTKCYCPAAPGMPLPTAGSLAAPTMAAGNPPVDPTLIPPIELLRDPDLFSILISALFDPRKPVNPQHRGKYLAILAFAASVYDIPTDSADATNGGLPMDLETAVRTTSSITGKSVRRVLDFYDVTYAALDAAHTICHKHSSSSDLQADMRALCPHLTFPVVAACVLYWIEVALISTHLLSNSFTTSTPPWHLAVLDEIAFQHSLHRPKVFALLQQLFAAEFDLDALVELSLKKAIFDRCIFLLSLDYVIPIVKFARECLVSDRVDLSLIRHFSSEVVEIVDAPYSKQFLDEFLPIVVDQRVVDGFKKGDQTAPFSQFFDSVVHSEQFSHLSEALQTSVKERLEAWRV